MRRNEDERGYRAQADFRHKQPNPHQLICESYVPVEKTTGKPFMVERMAKSLA